MGNPDPVSVEFERAAARLLERARSQRGQWVSVRLTDPTIRERTRWASLGINVDGPDPVPGGQAKTRWARALIRAIYREHKLGARSGAVRVEVGRHIPPSPQFDPANPGRGGFPPSRQFRVQIAQGGRAADKAVQRLPDSRRIYVPTGTEEGRSYVPGGRWANPGVNRDW